MSRSSNRSSTSPRTSAPVESISVIAFPTISTRCIGRPAVASKSLSRRAKSGAFGEEQWSVVAHDQQAVGELRLGVPGDVVKAGDTFDLPQLSAVGSPTFSNEVGK